MIIATVVKAIFGLVLVGLVFIAFNSSNIPEDKRYLIYIGIAAVIAAMILSKILSKVFSALSIMVLIAGIGALIFLLYKYDAIPLIDKKSVDNVLEDVGIQISE